MAAAPFAMGLSWMLVLLLGGAPLLQSTGLPPLPEDPVLAQVAPEQCLLYVSWAGRDVPDASSGNHTEALLADEDLRRLFETVPSEVLRLVRRESGDDPKGKLLVEALDLAIMALQRPAALFIAGITPSETGMDARMAFVVRMGEDAGRGRRILARMEQIIARETDGRTVPSPVPPLNVLPLPEGAPTVFYGVAGDDLVIAAGEETARSVLAGLAGNGSAPAWLETARASLTVERPAMVGYIDMAGIRRAAAPFLRGRFEGMLRLTGLDAVGSAASVAGLEGDGFVRRSKIVFDTEPRGLLSLIGDAALAPGDLAAVPDDATFALAGRLDPSAAYDRLRELLQELDPRDRSDLSEMLDEIERELGIRLDADLFDTLGDVWCVYSSPGDGGLLVSGLTVVVKVKDPATLERTLGRFVEAIRREEGTGRRRVTVGDFTFRGRRIHFLNAIGEEMPVAPAWCVTDDALIVAAYPQMVKSYLLRTAGSPTLADVPEVAALWDDDSPPVAFGYADTASIFRTVYPILHPVGNLLCAQLQKGGLAIDMSLLPAARSILPHLAPATRSVCRTEDGILVTSRGSVPVGGAGLGSAMPLLGMMISGVRTSVAVDELASVAAPGTESRAASTLKTLGVALICHANDHQGFPRSLDELVEAGYLSELPRDPWGAPFEYYAPPDDMGTEDDASLRPLAALSRGLPDGRRVVLYRDGRVDTVPEAVFQSQRQAQ